MFAVAHLIIHSRYLHLMSPADDAVLMSALAAAVVLPVWLLILMWRST